MKKSSFAFALASVISMMSLTTSCQDDNDYGTDSYSANSYSANQQTVDYSKDIANGYNVVIYGQDTLQNCSLPLNTNAPVTVTSEKNLVQMNCIKNSKGQLCLVPTLTSPQHETIEERIHITSQADASKQKDLTVVIRPKKAVSRAAGSEDPVQSRLSEIFAYGMYKDIIPGDQVTLQPVLSQSAISKYVNRNAAFKQGGFSIETRATSVEELTKEWCVKSGASFPVGTTPVMASIGLNLKSNSKQKHEREYCTVERGETKTMGVLNDTIVNRVEANSKFWLSVLDPNLNDYLNNGVTGKNNVYSLDEAGAMNIIKTYGTHIPTQLVLGSTCRLEASKTVDLLENSFEWGLSATVSQKKADAAGIAGGNNYDDKKALAEIFSKTGETGSGFIDVTNKESKVLNTSEIDEKMIYVGKGSLSGNQWNASTNPAEWAALSYGSKNSYAEPTFIPIYELIPKDLLKPGSAAYIRYNTLKNLIDTKEGGYPKYLKALGTLPAKSDKPENYVVCDFIFKAEGSANGEPFTGKVKNKFGQEVEVMYYPMAWNENNRKLDSAPNSWSYKTFDALKNCFICLCRSNDVYHHFYYAVLPESECNGIDAITFVPEESVEGYLPSFIPIVGSDKHNRGDDYKKAGWTRRTVDGHNCGRGVKAADCGKVVPYVHYRKEGSQSKPITAICLFNEDNIVFSSTAGTEYNCLDQQSTENFNKFWNGGSLQKKETTGGNTDEAHWYKYQNDDNKSGLNQKNYYRTSGSNLPYSWFRGSAITRQNSELYIGYSYRPISMIREINNKRKPLKALLPKKY